MEESKFEYFLNAVHYSLWRGYIGLGRFLLKMIDGFLLIFATLFLPKKYKERLSTYFVNNEKQRSTFLNNKKCGFNILFANDGFGFFYSCYSGFLSFVIAGILIRKFVAVINPAIMIVISIIPIGAFYIPAYKAVFTDDRYLKYFKQFEKEDKRWHKKWALITWAFCVGGIIIDFFGIITMMAIVSGGYSNINVPFLPH